MCLQDTTLEANIKRLFFEVTLISPDELSATSVVCLICFGKSFLQEFIELAKENNAMAIIKCLIFFIV
jgi:hypothetical protein